MQYLEVILMHHSLSSGVSSLAQVGKGGLGSLERTPKSQKWPKTVIIEQCPFMFRFCSVTITHHLFLFTMEEEEQLSNRGL